MIKILIFIIIQRKKSKILLIKSSIVDYECFISKYTIFNIAKDLTSKRSEKDIAIDNNVSTNTVERIIDSYYESKRTGPDRLYYAKYEKPIFEDLN